MTIERARIQSHVKPWGVVGVTPWSSASGQIGEIWFERCKKDAAETALQLKLLFTSQPLSIQVHPNDEQAIEAGFPHGKTEAWFVLASQDNAKVGVGLSRTCSVQDLRTASENGFLEALIDWRRVMAGDVINVPAGTIHAIGSGLVIAEIQQRSELTYRMHDYGRGRPLHLERAFTVCIPGPSTSRARSGRISDQRQLLSSTPFFCFERITLQSNSKWQIETPCETWVLAIDGAARFGDTLLRKSEAMFIEADQADLEAGPEGATLLVAYAHPSVLPYLLQRIAQTQPSEKKRTRGMDKTLLGKALQRSADYASASLRGQL